ncbi:MAG: hypothetical protein WC637_11035 [Victivallales bacterium]
MKTFTLSWRKLFAGSCCLMIHCLNVTGENTMVNSTGDFVRVSPRDPQYFELSNGKPYIPIGFNLVPAPAEEDFESVIRKMADNKINYCRLWLGSGVFDVEHTRSGEYDEARAVLLKKFLKLAGSRGIKVKLCLEYFRDIPAKKTLWSDRPWHNEANGGPFKNMEDFLNGDRGREQFKRKLAWYAQRIGDDPAVFSWELWNEMNCVKGPWVPWTKVMLPELHRLFPKNMAMQSLGSFDCGPMREQYRLLCGLDGNDVAQVHRYLDLGGNLEICHAPIDQMAADAVKELFAFNVRKPVILTETGAVKPGHTGVSELYAKDQDGMLLHDMLFAPFFSGSAGTGHVWWWREAIQKPDLWHQYARFAEALAGIDPPAEQFMPLIIPHQRFRVYALKGTRTLMAWCRDGRNDWRTELEQGVKPETVQGAKLDLSATLAGVSVKSLRCYDPWNNVWQDAAVTDGFMKLPDFRRSIIIRVDYVKQQ